MTIDFDKIKAFSFDELSIWMMTPTAIHNFKNMLNDMYDGPMNLSRTATIKIMASLMIVYHPTEILNSPEENNIIEHNIKEYSRDVVAALISRNTVRFDAMIDAYLSYFPIWKRVDKLFLLKNLYELYYEYEEFKKTPLQADVAEGVAIQQANIIGQINELSGGECQINKQLDDVYWVFLAEEIKATKYTRFIKILEDIKQLICAVVPSRTDIHREVNEIVDIEYISHMIEHDAIEDTYIFNMVNFLFEKLEAFQAAANDEDCKQWKAGLMGELANNIHYYDFFPKFFRELIKRFESIYIERKKFNDSLSQQ
jgi:hypothetical protein